LYSEDADLEVEEEEEEEEEDEEAAEEKGRKSKDGKRLETRVLKSSADDAEAFKSFCL